MGQDQTSQPDGRQQLELDVRLPRVVVDRLDGAGRRPAGVVHDPIDPPPARHGGLDEGFEVGRPGDVGPHGQDVGTTEHQLVLGHPPPFLVAPTHGD